MNCITKCTNEFRKAKSPNVVPKAFCIVFACNLLNMLSVDMVDAVDAVDAVDDSGVVPAVVYGTV